MQEWINGLVRQRSVDIVNQGNKATWIVESEPVNLQQATNDSESMRRWNTERMTQWIHGSWINESMKQCSRIKQPTEQYNQAQRNKESMKLWSKNALNPNPRTNVSMSQISYSMNHWFNELDAMSDIMPQSTNETWLNRYLNQWIDGAMSQRFRNNEALNQWLRFDQSTHQRFKGSVQGGSESMHPKFRIQCTDASMHHLLG